MSTLSSQIADLEQDIAADRALAAQYRAMQAQWLREVLVEGADLREITLNTAASTMLNGCNDVRGIALLWSLRHSAMTIRRSRWRSIHTS